MRTATCLAALLLVGLVACDSKKESSQEPSARAAREPVTQPSAQPSAVASQAPPPATASASAAAIASAAPDAAAASPCPLNAKNYDEPKFCITLPDKTLDVTYEGGPAEGNVELEAKGGGVIRLTWVPLARVGKESLKAQVERVEDGWELVASGDLPGGGAWSDMKKTNSDEKTQHVVRSESKTKKLLVSCHYTTTAENREKARDVCRSVRGY